MAPDEEQQWLRDMLSVAHGDEETYVTAADIWRVGKPHRTTKEILDLAECVNRYCHAADQPGMGGAASRIKKALSKEYGADEAKRCLRVARRYKDAFEQELWVKGWDRPQLSARQNGAWNPTLQEKMEYTLSRVNAWDEMEASLKQVARRISRLEAVEVDVGGLAASISSAASTEMMARFENHRKFNHRSRRLSNPLRPIAALASRLRLTVRVLMRGQEHPFR